MAIENLKALISVVSSNINSLDSISGETSVSLPIVTSNPNTVLYGDTTSSAVVYPNAGRYGVMANKNGAFWYTISGNYIYPSELALASNVPKKKELFLTEADCGTGTPINCSGYNVVTLNYNYIAAGTTITLQNFKEGTLLYVWWCPKKMSTTLAPSLTINIYSGISALGGKHCALQLDNLAANSVAGRLIGIYYVTKNIFHYNVSKFTTTISGTTN